ncbi:trypco2 family protein [Glycomyces arizonensis]|uniref:trypco2 family protein n=1 Tax=Glycomyces arizonensis TaxID=256035 RepID=UPI0004047F58|nr:trypco2 family protein [Glycomyces arizonensis]
MQIELKEALRTIRSQITEAMAEAEGQAVRFTVERINLEVQVGLTKGTEAAGGLKVWVLSGDAKASRESVVTQTLSIELSPETSAGGPVRIHADGRRAD